MWTWTKVVGRALINLGVVILGIVAAKELVDAGSDIVEAFQTGSEPPYPVVDSHPFPPMA